MKKSPISLFASCLFAVLAGSVSSYQVLGDTTTQTIYSFPAAPGSQSPFAALVRGTDGNFYGTTYAGGTYNLGTVFKTTPSGIVTVLHSFAGGTEGLYPEGKLVQGNDGYYYGTTYRGGSSDGGTIFRISSAGAFNTLHVFVGGPTDGNYPAAGLAKASDGNFYGSALGGGPNNNGILFRITSAGAFTILHSFTGDVDGNPPGSELIQATDGKLYGCSPGGAQNQGSIFSMMLDGSNFNVAAQFFGGDEGGHPNGIMQASDGYLYGTTQWGGDGAYFSTKGGVFRFALDGTLTPYARFSAYFGPNTPMGNLVQASDGRIYGVTEYSEDGQGNGPGQGTVYELIFQDYGYYPYAYARVLHTFRGTEDGANLYVGLAAASDGSVYGVATGGGTSGAGTIFKANANGFLADTVTISQNNVDAPGVPGAKMSAFGEPAMSDQGYVAFEGAMTGTGITTVNKYAIWANNQLIARTGIGVAPGTNGNAFKTLNDPVINGNGSVAFRALLIQGVAGTDTTNDVGIWANNSGDLTLVAREGTQAPGTEPGVNFLVISSYALPDQGGVVLTATLTGTNVTTANNQGIWAVDTNGVLQLIVRKGETLHGKTIKSLSFLPNVANSGGQTRSYRQTTGDLIYKAGFTDSSYGFFRVVFP